MNKKIKKSFDKILPSSNEKQIMLNNILSYKKPSFQKPLMILTTVCSCVMLLVLFPTTTNAPISEPSPLRISNDFYYEGVCYEEIGIYQGSKEDLEMISENKNAGGSFYKIKNSENIVIFFENYIEYQICGGEK